MFKIKFYYSFRFLTWFLIFFRDPSGTPCILKFSREHRHTYEDVMIQSKRLLTLQSINMDKPTTLMYHLFCRYLWISLSTQSYFGPRGLTESPLEIYSKTVWWPHQSRGYQGQLQPCIRDDGRSKGRVPYIFNRCGRWTLRAIPPHTPSNLWKNLKLCQEF